MCNILFLPEEPIMVATSEQDNSIKMYKFENKTSIPQILKFRSGHKASPVHLRFYGESANEENTQILSCDKFNLRNISLLSEQMSKEFSSKKFNNSIKKHSIISFDFNEFRERKNDITKFMKIFELGRRPNNSWINYGIFYYIIMPGNIIGNLVR